MQQIFIRVQDSDSGTGIPEWEMVELQGFLEARPEKDLILDSMRLGQISFGQRKKKKKKRRLVSLLNPQQANNVDDDNSDDERVELIVGRQLLEGKRVPLKRPMVVTRRVRSQLEDDEAANVSHPVSYDIVGICRHRLLFTSRPEPISPHVSPTGSPVKVASMRSLSSPIQEAFVRQALKRKQSAGTSQSDSGVSGNNNNSSKDKANRKPKIDFFALHSRNKKKK